VKHFSSRRYNLKVILYAIIEQAAVHFDEYKTKCNCNCNKTNYLGLGHRELKRKTEKALNLTFSTSTFDRYLDILVEGEVFTKYKRHARGGKADYRLTKRALQEFKAGVLQIRGIEPSLEVFADEEERYRLYHLLFTIETLEPPFVNEIYDTEEGMLERIRKLFGVSISSDDLVIESIQRKEVNCTVTFYKPVSCMHIAKKVFSKGEPLTQLDANSDATTVDSSSSSSPADLQQQQFAFYNLKAIGFSVTDIVNYDRKFGFVSLQDLTKSKVKRTVRLLTKAKIITPVGTLKGETRYAFADESLRKMVASCLIVFNHTIWLLSKVWQYERKVDKEERAWLEKVYGKRQADRIISDNYDFLISMGRESVDKEKESYNTEKKLLYQLVKKEVKEIKEKYGGLLIL
jgi:hypothetical protein